MAEEFINVKKRLMEGWVKTKGQVRQDIHVSSLIHCRRRVCAEILGEPEPLKERTFRSFLVGASIHALAQELLGEEFECEKEVSYTFPNGQKVVGHIDAFHKTTGTVVEIKTTNSVQVKDIGGVYPYHLTQLRNYMSMMGSTSGILLYVIMDTPYLSDYMPQYVMTMTEEERRRTLRHMEADATELWEAVDKRDLNHIQVWDIVKNSNYMTPDGSNWFCKNGCPLAKSKKCEEYNLFEQGKISDSDVIEKMLPKLKQLH